MQANFNFIIVPQLSGLRLGYKTLYPFWIGHLSPCLWTDTASTQRRHSICFLWENYPRTLFDSGMWSPRSAEMLGIGWAFVGDLALSSSQLLTLHSENLPEIILFSYSKDIPAVLYLVYISFHLQFFLTILLFWLHARFSFSQPCQFV